jgi:segregation and condensation protein B
MLRLVRDYDETEEIEDGQHNVSNQEEQAPTGKRRGGKRAATTGAAEHPATETDEMRDGQVEEDTSPANEAESADESAGSDIAVDLPMMEALLLGTHHPLTAGRLAELMDLPGTKPIRAAIKQLNEQYEQANRSFRIEQVAGGYQLLTLPQFGEALKKLHQKEIDAKLTKAALETLAIIAYKQPILRADVEAIRGVACGETIRSLMEKHLVKIAGRAEEPGRPILYGTTKRFLELFGLNSLKDLPKSEI